MSMSRFLPLTLRRQLAESKDLEEPLYLDGATLFADISGFTPLSEALSRMGREGAETLTRTLNGYFTAVITAILGNGGDVMRFAGDAVTAFFPDPRGVERALTAAHAIQAFMGLHPETTSPVGSFPIRIKVGIAAGEHVLLTVGEGRARDYVFAGHPVDGSAEAEHHAGPGEIVVKAKQFKVRSSKLKVEKLVDGFWRVLDLRPSAFSLQPSAFNLQPSAFSLQPSASEMACSPFLHPILVERLGQGSERLLNEHRKTTVLFVSFPGVSDYRDQAAVERLRAFYIKARSFVDCYEGNLNKVDMGDKGSKFLITFGAPLSHEDDADRAVRFALDLKDMAGTHSLSLAIGLNRGTIFAGLIGDDQRCEYTVMGDEVNLAARLMQAAGPGRILAGPGVQEESRAYEFTALPPIVLKGKSHPVAVFEPLQKEVEQKAGIGIFAGRTSELRGVVEFTRQPGEEVRLLLLQGEAGIGKTAFLNYLFQQHLSSIRLVSGWCREFTAQFPYHPWKFILRKLLEIADPGGGDPAEAWKAILQGTVPELVPFAPILLDLVQIQHALQPAVTDEQTRKSILHRQVGLLVQAARKQGPLVLSLTDVQWMDPESGGLLRDLLRTLEPPGSVFVLSGRDLPGDLQGLVPTRSISLNPLPEADLKKIALAFLKVQRAPEKLFSDAAASSSGNPLILQETLRAYLDAGYVTRDAQNPELLFLDETRKPSLPTTLEGVVMARFDRLPVGRQAILKALSVFGDSIPGEVARRAAIDTGNDPALLDALVDDGEFITWQGPEGLCAFPQSHVRSTIYDSLDFNSRRDLHCLAARIFRDALPTDSPETIQTVAFHYLQADAIFEGKAFLHAAGRFAHEAYALPTALKYYQALMKHSEILESEILGAVASALSSIYLKVGKFKEIQALITSDLVDKVPDGDERSRLLLNLADSYRFMGAFSLAESQLTLAEKNARSALLKFQINISRGTMYAQTGQLEKALVLFQRLSRDYRNKVPDIEISRIAVILGPLLFSTGNQKQALVILNNAKRKMLRTNDIQYLIRVLHNQGSFLGISASHRRSLRAFLLSKSYQENFGVYQHLNPTLNEIGCEYMLLGRWKEAQYYFDLCLSRSRREEDPIQVRVHSNLSELKQYEGDYASAARHLKQAERLSRQYGSETLHVSFYWVELFANLPYPNMLWRCLGYLKRQIDQERAQYIQNLYQAYLAYYYALVGDKEKARKIARSTLEEAGRQDQPKEAYLATRTMTLVSPASKEIGEQLVALGRSTNLKQYLLDALVCIMKYHPGHDAVRQGESILRVAPFANLGWKYHLGMSKIASAEGLTAAADRHARKAMIYYDRIRASISWKAVRLYFENQSEAADLRCLMERNTGNLMRSGIRS